MSNTSINLTKKTSYIDARLIQVRLVSENATCAPAFPNKDPQQVQLRTDTASGFTIGLDLPAKPTVIVISINYKASLKIQDTGKDVIEYEATHEAQFAIEGWTGFDDWLNMPADAVAPYLTVVNNIAIRKAEAIILEMGIKGVTLPQTARFNGDLSPVEVEQGKTEQTGS